MFNECCIEGHLSFVKWILVKYSFINIDSIDAINTDKCYKYPRKIFDWFISLSGRQCDKNECYSCYKYSKKLRKVRKKIFSTSTILEHLIFSYI